jgi:hypothetical protein
MPTVSIRALMIGLPPPPKAVKLDDTVPRRTFVASFSSSCWTATGTPKCSLVEHRGCEGRLRPRSRDGADSGVHLCVYPGSGRRRRRRQHAGLNSSARRAHVGRSDEGVATPGPDHRPLRRVLIARGVWVPRRSARAHVRSQTELRLKRPKHALVFVLQPHQSMLFI